MDKRKLVNEIAKTVGDKKGAQDVVDWISSPFDKTPQPFDDSEKKKFVELLAVTEEKLRKVEKQKPDWWMAEIYLRKGLSSAGILEKERQFPIWRKAYEYAMKSENNEVLVQSALSLGFDFYEFTSSIREIIEIHISAVKAICAHGAATSTRLRIMGINLFNFWHQINFRRLSERELKAKQWIIDSAKSLESAGFDEDQAAPIMVLLIASLFEFDDPALEWAYHETAIIDIPVPDGIKKKLDAMKPKFVTSD
jgi:hypothetical protein